MRDAVGDVFGGLERVDTGDAKHRWRLRSDAVRRLVGDLARGARGARVRRLGPRAAGHRRAGRHAPRASRRRFVHHVAYGIARPDRVRARGPRPGRGPCHARGSEASARRRSALRLARSDHDAAAWWSSGTSRRRRGWKAWQRVTAPGASLRKPRVPRRVERLERGTAPLAPRQRERAPHQRRDLRAGPGLRAWSGTRSVHSGRSRRSPSRSSSGSTPPRPGTRRPSSSIRTSRSRPTTTDRSPSASRRAASTRCAGTSSPGGTASR